MPRLRQVPRGESDAEIVEQMYQQLFGDRDPVAEPGTATGTPGNWWTVFALVPDVFRPRRARLRRCTATPPGLHPRCSGSSVRPAPAGPGAASSCSRSTASRAATLGMPEEKIAAIPSWAVATCFDPAERAVLAYTDALVLDGGRVPDGVFDELRAPPLRRGGARAHLHHRHVRDARRDRRALRLEWDDRDDPIVEVAAPEGAARATSAPTSPPRAESSSLRSEGSRIQGTPAELARSRALGDARTRHEMTSKLGCGSRLAVARRPMHPSPHKRDGPAAQAAGRPSSGDRSPLGAR